MTRDERQFECVKNWLRANGRGAVVAPTGTGKTRIAILCIKAILKKFNTIKVLVVVPTSNLKTQWEENLKEWNLNEYCEVKIINTVVLNNYEVDMLVLDELHVYASHVNMRVFACVKYNLLLGLTATYERLDGRHIYLEKYCPIIDKITLADTVKNNWIAKYTEYQVLIDVENIDEYKKIQHENTKHFEYFGFDFGLVMSLTGKNGFEKRKLLASKMCTNKSQYLKVLQEITIHATGFMRTMQAKKLFINNHSKKIEIARKIIESRIDSKILTFSNNIKMADSIGYGKTYSGKNSKKEGDKIMQEFNDTKYGVLNSSRKLIAGADIRDLNCLIILGQDSSNTRATQTRGRALRVEGDKYSEVFNLVLNDTQECTWFQNSHKGAKYVTIDVNNLEKVLNYESYETYRRPLSQFNYRF